MTDIQKKFVSWKKGVIRPSSYPEHREYSAYQAGYEQCMAEINRILWDKLAKTQFVLARAERALEDSGYSETAKECVEEIDSIMDWAALKVML